jgi:hypothetical protein
MHKHAGLISSRSDVRLAGIYGRQLGSGFDLAADPEVLS